MKKYNITEEKFNQIYNDTNYEIDYPFVISKYRNVKVGRITDMADDTTQYIIYENFYKFTNDIERDIVMMLLQSNYNFLGRGGSYFFATREKGDERYEGERVNLTSPISGKTFVRPQIEVSSGGKYDPKNKVRIVIRFYIPSHCTDDTVFEGWVESINEFKTIWKCVGLP